MQGFRGKNQGVEGVIKLLGHSCFSHLETVVEGEGEKGAIDLHSPENIIKRKELPF